MEENFIKLRVEQGTSQNKVVIFQNEDAFEISAEAGSDYSVSSREDDKHLIAMILLHRWKYEKKYDPRSLKECKFTQMGPIEIKIYKMHLLADLLISVQEQQVTGVPIYFDPPADSGDIVSYNNQELADTGATGAAGPQDAAG